MERFDLAVANWANESTDEIHSMHKAIILELFTSVILDTPVLEGRLRGNWIMTFNSAANGTLKIQETTTGSESNGSSDSVRGPVTSTVVGNVFAEIAKLPKGADFLVFLSNNLPYANRIEYDGWSHTKAPAGMVRKNMVRITSNLQKLS